MNALQTRLTDWIDAHFDDEVRFLQAVVRIPTDTPPGNNARTPRPWRTCWRAPAGPSSACGASAAGHRLRPGKHHEPDRAPAVRCRRADAGAQCAWRTWYLRAKAGPIRVWRRDRDGYLYGRAAAVSKSDFATYVFAVRALEALGAPLRGGVELHFNV